MPKYVGPSHGLGGPTIVLTLDDTARHALVSISRIAVRTPYDDYMLRFRSQSTEGGHTDHGRMTSTCTLYGLRPERHNMPEQDMLDLLRSAATGEHGYRILMDVNRIANGTPAPDTEILSISVVRDGTRTELAALATPADITPITPCYEEDIPSGHPTRLRIAGLIARATEEYAALPDAKGWTKDEFVAEYLIRHGVQADLNWAEKDSIPVAKWHT